MEVTLVNSVFANGCNHQQRGPTSNASLYEQTDDEQGEILNVKFSELISALESFFNDILGSIVPGGLLIVGLYESGALKAFNVGQIDFSNGSILFVLVIMAYLLGHMLDQTYLVVLRLFRQVSKGLVFAIATVLKPVMPHQKRRQLCISLQRRWRSLFSPFSTESSGRVVFELWVKRQSDDLFDLESAEIDAVIDNIRDTSLRSIALTTSEEGTLLSRRFKFIALLCSGSAMAFFILGIVSTFLVFMQSQAGEQIAKAFIYKGAAYFLFAGILHFRAGSFERRSQVVGFDCAAAEILKYGKSGWK